VVAVFGWVEGLTQQAGEYQRFLQPFAFALPLLAL
jgi:hypothetical protein